MQTFNAYGIREVIRDECPTPVEIVDLPVTRRPNGNIVFIRRPTGIWPYYADSDNQEFLLENIFFDSREVLAAYQRTMRQEAAKRSECASRFENQANENRRRAVQALTRFENSTRIRISPSSVTRFNTVAPRYAGMD